MIVPMYHYSFLVFHADYEDFVKNLKEIGVAHMVEHKEDPTPEIEEQYRLITDLSQKIKQLERKASEVDITSDDYKEEDGKALYRLISTIEQKKDQLNQDKTALEKEYTQVEPWGYFKLDDIRKLEKAGLHVRFLVCPVKKYKQSWENEHPISVISDYKGFRHFVAIDEDPNKDYPSLLPKVDEIARPGDELENIERKIEENNGKIEEIEEKHNLIAVNGLEALKKYKAELEDKLGEVKVRFQTSDEAEGKVKFLEAWVPETNVPELDKWLEKQEAYYIKKEGKDEDKPPILLKNNRYSRLFEPVAKLFSLPKYGELDLTPFFAPFFMMFFGFCLGDAGYGIIMLVATAIYKRKANPDFKPVLSLVQWLGFATVLFGVLTGTVFGVNLNEAPIPFLSDVRAMFLDEQQMFNLALIFGLIQILFGMILKAINQIKQKGFLYSVSTWGWFILIVSSGIFYLLDEKSPDQTLMWSLPHLIILGVAGLGIFIFNDPKRNIFINFGAGLWDAYNMITGVIGDLLSYIRLFALGLSSAILGLVFNQLAFDLSPDVIVVKQIVILFILLIGHSINIFMSGLGAFVHPLRLTFVEFYKNAGFAGGGKEYKPFKKVQY
ncbi:MAG TPA: V-type ATPase 116kDa subunit family protein [Salinivirga sp.]|uniref:V-type ATP synthase subunit I n=1 Tax=Salinivirga sp. TaxID=1970192 RepID=UPI002B46CC41|nr:V-type ATPase 116kDa subunit family protein [Salinivirga sp.]HKK60648.1 V-type ATPase 116kDa subunit family protein [Salinivirga sp.]